CERAPGAYQEKAVRPGVPRPAECVVGGLRGAVQRGGLLEKRDIASDRDRPAGQVRGNRELYRQGTQAGPQLGWKRDCLRRTYSRAEQCRGTDEGDCV